MPAKRLVAASGHPPGHDKQHAVMSTSVVQPEQSLAEVKSSTIRDFAAIWPCRFHVTNQCFIEPSRYEILFHTAILL